MATWRANNSMLTAKGIEILNRVKAGIGKITITRIVAGSGMVDETSLFSQTSVSGLTKPLVISQVSPLESGSEISVYITNSDLTEAFELKQIGIYVSHPDYLEEQLYHISQCDREDFDTIPAFEYTAITFGYSIFLEHGNSESIEITIDPQGMVTRPEFDTYKGHIEARISNLTYQDVGSAPTGFGLGETTITEFSSTHELNSLVKSGWYSIKFPSLTTVIPGYSGEYLQVRVDSYGPTNLVQTARFISSPYIVQRILKNNIWTSWAWVNPPLIENVEYPTTEYYQGVSVIKKVDSLGNLLWKKAGENDWRTTSSNYVVPATLE